ncbi:MAG: hypothetical protein AMJ62_14150 [Myxococcales bacterium SG8_38]|nr:MAG: hypothetical protein AMJ62_14150 [Myxococcales bacterium SG8_38]
MRDQAPERLDQSRIRVHEEPEPDQEPTGRTSTHQRIRKHTKLGMQPPTPAASEPAPSSAPAAPPPAPTSIASGRSRSRASQKTMLGIPRPEFLQPPGAPMPADVESVRDERPAEDGTPAGSGGSQSHRARARVRYDSGDEPLPVVQRRRKALRSLAVLVLLAAAWLGYRLFQVHG